MCVVTDPKTCMYMQSRRERKRVSEIHGSEALSVSLLQFCERGLKSCSFHCITFGGERERESTDPFSGHLVCCVFVRLRRVHIIAFYLHLFLFLFFLSSVLCANLLKPFWFQPFFSFLFVFSVPYSQACKARDSRPSTSARGFPIFAEIVW